MTSILRVFIASFLVAGAYGAPPPSAQLLLSSVGFTINGAPLSLKDFKPGVLDGIEIKPAADGWQIRAFDRPVNIRAQGFSSCQAQLPVQQEIFLKPDWQRTILDWRTPVSNTNLVLVTLPDGGTVSLLGSSTGRLDYLKDNTYYVWARGSASGTNSDGGKVSFSAVFPPLFGGPLQPRSGTNGIKTFARLSPVLPVTMSAFTGKELTLRVGEESVSLKAGEKRTIKRPNGAEIEFYLNEQAHTAEWEVRKGSFRFLVEGFQCWKALGLAGDAGSQQWDEGTRSINLRNLAQSSGNPLLLTLASRVNVAVFPKATFQYAAMDDCQNFATSGAGGPILLYNDLTKQTTQLQTENLLFRSGVAVNPSAPSSGAKEVVRLGWQKEANVEIRTKDGLINIPSDVEKVLEGQGSAKIHVEHLNGNEVRVTVLQGDVELRPDVGAGGLHFDLQEGQSIIITKGPSGFQFKAAASSSSGVPQVTFGGGPPTLLSGQINIVGAGAGGSVPANGTGALIFMEGAGGTSVLEQTSPPTGLGSPSGGLESYQNRIDQLPVSPKSPGGGS